MADTIRISIGLARDWVQEKRKNTGNPVRALEKCVAAIEGASLVSSSCFDMTAMIPEESVDQYLVDVLRVVVNRFDAPRADEIMSVVGVEADLKMVLQEVLLTSENAPAERPVPAKKPADIPKESEAREKPEEQEKTTEQEKTAERTEQPGYEDY